MKMIVRKKEIEDQIVDLVLWDYPIISLRRDPMAMGRVWVRDHIPHPRPVILAPSPIPGPPLSRGIFLPPFPTL